MDPLPNLGVTAIDKDHQDTVDLINNAANASDPELGALMQAAFDHLTDHFAREEKLMDECNFFASHCHKDEHKRVLGEAYQFNQAAQRGNWVLVRAYLTDHFPTWLRQHADSMDTVTMAAYRAHIQG